MSAYFASIRDGQSVVVERETGRFAYFTHSAVEAAKAMSEGKYSPANLVWHEARPVSVMLATRIANGDTAPTEGLVRRLAKSYLNEIARRKRAEGNR